jgi:predicted RNA-binding Zn ribbon-like protein
MLDRVGGHPALDFANTLGGLRDGPWDDEWLHDYADLAGWARHAGLLDARAALAALEAAHRDALARAALVPTRGHLDWAFPHADDDLDRPARHAALAAVDLLRSERVARLKQCANCRWLFLDASRNASRRWCSMAHCGTGAKVAATRERRRAARR